MRTLAVMQPYFLPYGGYFQLLAASDVFVLFDCVQFPRRGRVHRCQFRNDRGQLEWLTLPIAKSEMRTAIRDMRLADPASTAFLRQSLRLQRIASGSALGPALSGVGAVSGASLATYLKSQIEWVADKLGIDTTVIMSSSLNILPQYTGERRILEICKTMQAARYVNAPGGRNLYDEAQFARAGIRLGFLDDYVGSGVTILQEAADVGLHEVQERVSRYQIDYGPG